MTKSKVVQCPICCHSLQSMNVLINCLLKVVDKRFPCLLCKTTSNGLENYIRHLTTHRAIEKNCEEGVNDFTLHDCDLANFDESKNTNHAVLDFIEPPEVSEIANYSIEEKNIDGSSEAYGLNLPSEEDVINIHKNLHEDKIKDVIAETNTPTFSCHICTKVFKMRGTLMVHLRIAHYGNQYTKPLAKLNLEKSSTECEIRTSALTANAQQDNKNWLCDVCQKSFTTKYFLKKHKRLHTGETPYTCTMCNKSFTFQQSYHKHLLYHNDDKPYKCQECGRSFKELSTLHNHQRIHTGERPFSCETCGKSFRQRVSYLVHKRIHTGALPYHCTACNISFRYKVSQRTHKCTAQPPGVVVRKPALLFESIMKNFHNNAEEKKLNEEIIRKSASLCLEDTESENFSILPQDRFDDVICRPNECFEKNERNELEIFNNLDFTFLQS